MTTTPAAESCRHARHGRRASADADAPADSCTTGQVRRVAEWRNRDTLLPRRARRESLSPDCAERDAAEDRGSWRVAGAKGRAHLIAASSAAGSVGRVKVKSLSLSERARWPCKRRSACSPHAALLSRFGSSTTTQAGYPSGPIFLLHKATLSTGVRWRVRSHFRSSSVVFPLAIDRHSERRFGSDEHRSDGERIFARRGPRRCSLALSAIARDGLRGAIG
jgi:hypothetical protein